MARNQCGLQTRAEQTNPRRDRCLHVSDQPQYSHFHTLNNETVSVATIFQYEFDVNEN